MPSLLERGCDRLLQWVPGETPAAQVFQATLRRGATGGGGRFWCSVAAMLPQLYVTRKLAFAPMSRGHDQVGDAASRLTQRSKKAQQTPLKKLLARFCHQSLRSGPR